MSGYNWKRLVLRLSALLVACASQVCAEQETPFSQTPFALQGNTMPKGFAGHDLRMVYTRIYARLRPEKDEFETTAEFKARVAKEETSPLYGTLSLADTFSLVVPTECSYDADERRLIVTADLLHRYKYGTYVLGIKAQEFYKRVDKETATNGFGAVFETKTISSSHVVLAIQNHYNLIFDEKIIAFNVLGVSADNAKRLKRELRLAFIFKLVEPYISEDVWISSKATFSLPSQYVIANKILYSNLSEVIIFNRTTGEICYRKKLNAEEP